MVAFFEKQKILLLSFLIFKIDLCPGLDYAICSFAFPVDKTRNSLLLMTNHSIFDGITVVASLSLKLGLTLTSRMLHSNI